MAEQPFLISGSSTQSTSDQTSSSRPKNRPRIPRPRGTLPEGTLPEPAPPSEAEVELSRLIKEHPSTIGRYVTWQWNWNREYHDYDDPAVIVPELARSRKRGSNHTIYHSFLRGLTAVSKWKLEHKTWEDAMPDGQSRMPRLPTSQQVKALRYLSPTLPGFSENIVEHARRADLEWLLWDGPQSTFWRGLPIDDKEWRSENMYAGRPWGQPPVEELNVKTLPGLIKAVFPKRPEGVVDYTKAKRVLPRNAKSGRFASGNRRASPTADHTSDKGSSEWGDSLITESDPGASFSATDDLKHFNDESLKRDIDKLFSLPTTRPEARAKLDSMELPKGVYPTLG